MDFWIPAVLIGIAIGLIVFVAYTVPQHAHEREAARIHFMEDCQRDHKEYECTAMYRQTTCRDDSTIIMMPMYTGR